MTVLWVDVVAIAARILGAPPLNERGDTDPKKVLEQAVQSDPDLGTAAASLINDPIELRTTGLGTLIVDNGRHRIAAMIDQDVSSEIPFRSV